MTPQDLKRIQTALGVAADGVWGPITRGKLFAALGIADAPVAAPGGLRVNEKGLTLMRSFEGCKLDAYPDPGSRDGKPVTIGWGSTGPDIALGMRWTQEQADARHEQDVAKFAAGVEKLLNGTPTNSDQFSALVSLAYNIGLGALGSSTLLKLHKAGDHAGAAAQFIRWNKNDGRVMNGLTRRREAEARLYRGEA
jgi:lysozyme